MIYIHKGDDTIFGPQDKFLTFILNTDLDLTGWKAKFKLDGFIIYIHDISSKQFEVILTHHMTVQLPLGEIYGSITLIDDKQQVRTITNSIPFEVTCEVVENQYETVDLTIPEPSDVEVKLRIGGQAVYSVNGKTGEVILTPEDIGAISEDTLIPLATYEYVDSNINNTQVQINNINLELDNTNTRLNQKAEISYVDGELSRKANISDLNSKANVSAIPTRVSQLVNDEGYITEHQDISSKADIDYVENSLTYKADKINTYTKVEVDTLIDEKQDVGEYALISDIPTKVSQLSNDIGYINSIPDEYITQDKVYNKDETDILLASKQPYGDYALSNQIPTKVSQLSNDTKFITLDDVTGLIPPTQPFTISVVDVLPAKGESGVIYLIPKSKQDKDVYKEYIWVENTSAFELIGTTAIDLTNYVKNTNYATSTTAGVIKTNPTYGVQTDSTGRLLGSIQSLDQYSSFTNNGLISKGTLENIKNDYIRRAITNNNISLTAEEKTSAQSWLGMSDYITDEELKSKNFITEATLNSKGYITKEDITIDETDPIYTSDKPNIVFKNQISSVATTGKYSDLTGKPNIPENTSELNNDTGFITNNDILNKADIAYVDEQFLLKADKAYTYTKSEVDDLISDVVAGGDIDLSEYAKTQDVDNKLSLKANTTDVYTKEDIDDKNYTTLVEVTQQGYAKTEDIPSLDGLATEVQLTEGLNTKQDKGDYALKTDIPEIPNNISAFNNDMAYVTNTDYATAIQGGVVKFNSIYGNGVLGSGVVTTVKSTDDEIIAKSQKYRPIVPANLDLAVKTGITTNSYELTDNEKANVKQWLGYADNTDIMQAIANIPQFKLLIVDELPLSGEKMTLYFVPKEGTEGDIYNEYIWIDETQAYEFLGSTAVDLTDYVKNTDYVTTSKAGIVAVGVHYGTQILNTQGLIGASTRTLELYNSAPTSLFVGKGTLENIKNDYVKRGLTENSIELTEDEKASAKNWLGYTTITDIPTNVSQLTNDVNYLTSIPVEYTKYIETTYAELVELKNNANLEVGARYRITDYVTTTNGHSPDTSEPSRSAGHPFDIIVQAVSNSTFSDIASCVLHDGDTYFANQNLGAWQIWYDINNDTSKYKWADTTNGKGVIYRMIDEKNNDLSYDFKNIQFYRDNTLEKYAGTAVGLLAEDGYYYTFTDLSNGIVEDFSLTVLTNNNSIKTLTSTYGDGKTLNNIVIVQFDNDEMQIQGNSFGFNCYSNTFIRRFYSNTFSGYCYQNIINGVCYGNTFGTYFWGNTFGHQMYSNYIGNYCFRNNMGEYFYGNTIDGYFQYNTSGYNFSRNNIANGFLYCTIGNAFMYNTTGLWTQYLTAGDNAQYNTIGANTGYINIGSYNRYLNIGTYCAFIKTCDGDASQQKYGTMYTLIHNGVMGKNGSPLDLTGLPTHNNYNVEIKKSKTSQVIATWMDGTTLTGLYKETPVSDTWLELP